MAVLMATTFAACSKDDNQSAQEKKMKGLWTLGAVVTQINYADGTVKRDSTNYTGSNNFVFNEDGTFTAVLTTNGETNQGAGNWSEGSDGRITIVTGYDNATYVQYVVNTLTDTNLQFSNSTVSGNNTIHTSFYLNK